MNYPNFKFHWYKLKTLINKELPFFPINLIKNIDENVYAIVNSDLESNVRELSLIAYWFEFKEYIFSKTLLSKVSPRCPNYMDNMDNILNIDLIIRNHSSPKNKEPKISKFQAILDS